MSKQVELSDETHKQLATFKYQNDLLTMDQAVKVLLQRCAVDG